MKVLECTVPVLISLSILIPSGVVAEFISPADRSNISDHTLTAQGRLFSTPELDEQHAGEEWALVQTRMANLPAGSIANTHVLVAILDTGIDQNHEELKGRVVSEINFTDSPTTQDINGHGTHVAGIIAANSLDDNSIAGTVPESQLLSIKVANDRGRCQSSAVAKGIIWAVDNGASVINISLEIGEPSAELEDAVNYAWNQGAVIIAAAGNEGGQLPVYPAYYEKSIAVAAIREDGTLAPLSNYGDWVDVAAPGYNIYSTLPDNRYGYKSGTSLSAAYISGVAALLYGVLTDTDGDGRLNNEVREAIETRFRGTRFSNTVKIKTTPVWMLDSGLAETDGTSSSLSFCRSVTLLPVVIPRGTPIPMLSAWMMNSLAFIRAHAVK